MHSLLGCAFFSKSAKFSEVLSLFTCFYKRWEQSTFLALPTLPGSLLQGKGGRAHRVSQWWCFDNQVWGMFPAEPRFGSDKHAAVHHLLLLLYPPACPHLACNALTPRVLLDKRNSDIKEFYDADFKADLWCSFFAVVQATVCLSSAARGYKLAQWLCPKFWDQNKYKSLEIMN